MRYHIRFMRKEDIPQVTQIDREAFSSMWPPVNFQHELNNRMAHYVVAYDDEKSVDKSETGSVPVTGFRHVLAIARRLLGDGPEEEDSPATQYIAGFVGLWLMADEAHIINIAVRESYRGRGIGELLFIASIDLALELKAWMMTLEVRASNFVAQRLYAKYGFTQVGLRRGYYTDNKEDAALMSTESLNSTSFLANFRGLKEAHLKKMGMADYQLAAR